VIEKEEKKELKEKFKKDKNKEVKNNKSKQKDRLCNIFDFVITLALRTIL
jgi:hypothetical protein